MKILGRTIDNHTLRLTLSYLLIIMAMSIGFSVVFYRTSSRALERQLPPPAFFEMQHDNLGLGNYNDFLQARIAEGKTALRNRLILMNLFVLAGGTVISYYLARVTLRPIEEAMEAQTRFSSDASHELRTPLTAIRARNEVALRGNKLDLDQAKAVIKSNLEEVKKLETLSTGLLKLTQRSKGDPEKSPVALQEVASEAMNGVIDAAQSKHIAIHDTVPAVTVMAHAAVLTQVTTILLENAIKYSDPDTTIYMEGSKKGRYGYLAIRDEGPGIRASDLPHIFERFYRADHSRTKQGDNGYGLGLSIAKKLMDQLDGEIIVESALDRGSTFTIKLPAAGG